MLAREHVTSLPRTGMWRCCIEAQVVPGAPCRCLLPPGHELHCAVGAHPRTSLARIGSVGGTRRATPHAAQGRSWGAGPADQMVTHERGKGSSHDEMVDGAERTGSWVGTLPLLLFLEKMITTF